jgi:hypothetical protein
MSLVMTPLSAAVPHDVVLTSLRHLRTDRLVLDARTADDLAETLVWRGPDRGNPDPAAVRIGYADRPLGPELLGVLAG